jgi:hypothetical protein
MVSHQFTDLAGVRARNAEEATRPNAKLLQERTRDLLRCDCCGRPMDSPQHHVELCVLPAERRQLMF